MCLFISHLSNEVEKSASSVCVCYKIWGWFSFSELYEELWMLSSLICFPLPLCVLWCISLGDQDSNPICGVTHKGRSIPIQTNNFLLRLKSKQGWCWRGDRISRMYEVWNGWSPQTRFAGRSRTEASMGRLLESDPDLSLLSKGPHPNLRGAPLPAPAPSRLLFFPNWRVWMQALGSAPRQGAASQSSRKGPLPEDGVNRLSLKVTSSGSGSGSQRKLQSFFRAVNAKRKMHWVTAFLHAPGQRSAFSQGISLPNKASFFLPEPGIDLE